MLKSKEPNISSFAPLPETGHTVLVEILLRLADDRLIHGHRLSEWAGYAPELEEDLALANIALDMIGHATALYKYAAQLEGKQDEDEYAFFRDDIDFKNIAMVELPRGDFAFTMARLFLFSSYSHFLYQRLTETMEDEQVRGILQKHAKEIRYHLRHSREWILRLGDGTEESHRRIQLAFDEIWMYTGELFATDDIEKRAAKQHLYIDPSSFRPEWKDLVTSTLKEATLSVPGDDLYMFSGARQGRHTEYLGRLLAEMQFLRRSHPDAKWK